MKGILRLPLRMIIFGFWGCLGSFMSRGGGGFKVLPSKVGRVIISIELIKSM